MSTSANPLAAFQQFVAQQKAAAPQQGRSLDDYLAARAKQYGATPKGGTGWTGATVLDNPFAGLKEFGTYERPRLEYVGQGEEGGYEYKTDTVNKTAGDILSEKFKDQLGHKSVFLKAYKKDDKGNPVETNLNALTPEEINSGNVILYMGGKTGGTERERMAQAYIPKGDKLIPVGDPSYYKGEHPDAKNVANALKIAAIASLPFGGIGGLLSGVTGTAGAAGAAGAALGELGINTAGSGLAGTLASAGLPSFAADAAAKALVSGVLSGGIGSLTDQPFSKGFKTGATSSLASDVIGAGINKVAPDMFKGLGSLATPAKALTTQALTAKVLGRKFDPAAAIKGAAINYGIGQGLQTAGVDPKAFNQFMQFAAPMIAARRRPGGR